MGEWVRQPPSETIDAENGDTYWAVRDGDSYDGEPHPEPLWRHPDDGSWSLGSGYGACVSADLLRLYRFWTEPIATPPDPYGEAP